MNTEDLEDALPVDEPAADFAQRTVAAAREARVRRKQRRIATGVATVALAAAAVLVVMLPALRGPAPGSAHAAARQEVRVAERGVAVLEPGARIAWRKGEVEQAAGDVFYRVEPGDSFRVNTPAGTVEVVGTCFRVRLGTSPEHGGHEVNKKAVAVGSAVAITALVLVYEGRVQLLGAKAQVALGAGEVGRLTSDGAEKLDPESAARAQAALDDEANESSDKIDLSRANDALAGDIANLNRRLRKLEQAKSKLEAQLTTAQTELARRTDGKAPRSRDEFDLDQEDWAELAKTGTIKYRLPCVRKGGWKPPAERLDEFGLSPADAETIHLVYQRSFDRLWPPIRKLCAQAIGKDDVVDVLGADTCTHLIVDLARRADGKAASEAMRQLTEVRAGLRPAPDAAVGENPVYRLFFGLTGEMKAFEADLAESFGPDEAKRLAYGGGFCGGSSTFGGPGPRE